MRRSATLRDAPVACTKNSIPSSRSIVDRARLMTHTESEQNQSKSEGIEGRRCTGTVSSLYHTILHRHSFRQQKQLFMYKYSYTKAQYLLHAETHHSMLHQPHAIIIPCTCVYVPMSLPVLLFIYIYKTSLPPVQRSRTSTSSQCCVCGKRSTACADTILNGFPANLLLAGRIRLHHRTATHKKRRPLVSQSRTKKQ